MKRPDAEEEAFRQAGVQLDPHTLQDLRSLPGRMADIGYEEHRVAELLKLVTLTLRTFHHIPAYRRCLKGSGPLGTAIEFWLLQQSVGLNELRACLGGPVISALDRLGWLALSEDGIRSRVELYPAAGHYFFTDCYFKVAGEWPDQVYWLGGDSYQLAHAMPRSPRKRALDICTGSGIHAILARKHCQLSLGLDINPRALAFSQLNTALNGLHCSFELSDCYQAAGPEPFEQITLNPPFVPCPENIDELYRAGGGSGESVTEVVVRGLPEHLAPGGLFAMTTEAAITHDSSPLERMQRWLGSQGWGLAALCCNRFPVDSYVLPHALASIDYRPEDQVSEYERWLEGYERQGISAMVQGLFFAVRLPDGQPGWMAERWIHRPNQTMGGEVEEWLNSLQRWHSPQPPRGRAQLHPLVRAVYRGEEGAVVEFQDEHWSPKPLFLDPLGRETLDALVDGQDLGEVSSQTDKRDALGLLVREMVLRLPPD